MTDKPLKAELVSQQSSLHEYFDILDPADNELMYVEAYEDRIEIHPAHTIFNDLVAFEDGEQTLQDQVVCEECGQVFKAEDYGGDIGRARKARGAHGQQHSEDEEGNEEGEEGNESRGLDELFPEQ